MKVRYLVYLLVAACWVNRASAELHSYATSVGETIGITADEAQAALGPPDYVFTEGTFREAFTAVFVFPAPIDDVTDEDLILHIFVEADSTDTTRVAIDGRAEAEDPFVELAVIETGDARVESAANPFAAFDHVHEFLVDFDGRIDKVSEIRVTNAAGAELKLDAVEAVHPAIAVPTHAVELRVFRLREDDAKRFALRFKNIGPLEGGAVMTGFAVEHTTDAFIDQTNLPVFGPDGQFLATEETTAGPDNGDVTMRTLYQWNVEGEGLYPGETASHFESATIDTDVPGDEFLENIVFSLFFDDGLGVSVDWDVIQFVGAEGRRFALYQYPPGPVSISGPRPTYYVEVTDAAIVPESLCIECYVPNEPNGNSDDPDDPDDPTPPAAPRTCGPAALGVYALLFASLVGTRRVRCRAVRCGIRE